MAGELHPEYVELTDLEQADDAIREADQRVDAATEACIASGMSPQLRELQAASREQDRAYAGRNALVLEHIERQYRRFGVTIRWIVGVLAVFLVVLAAAQYEQARHNHSQTIKDQQRIKMALQESRFDSNYNSCVTSNERHDLAVGFIHKILIAQLGKSPTAAAKAAGEKGAAEFDTLINDLAPLKPNCRAYAHQQIKLPAHPE